MAPKTKQYGPIFVRQQVIAFEHIDSASAETGWRDPNEIRAKMLTETFLGGSYGLGVTCGVQILEKESANGQKIIDDGVSTVAALKACAASYFESAELAPKGEVWSQALVDIFRIGIAVRVMSYSDDDDREARVAWNTAKHDEETNSVRWASCHQKVGIALNRWKVR